MLFVYIYAPEEAGDWPPGSASRWWLHHSLASFDASLRKFSSRLTILRGPSSEALLGLAKAVGAGAVYWSDLHEPALAARDVLVRERLMAAGLVVESFNGSLLHEPWTISNQSGKPYQVFTRFWIQCLSKPAPQEPLAAPAKLRNPEAWPDSLSLNELGLLPKINWTGNIGEAWSPGEDGARVALDNFLNNSFSNYVVARDYLGRNATSRLSPHLHFGEISPRQVWRSLRLFAERNDIPEETWRSSQFLSEIGWREFSHHLLYHFPQTPHAPLRPGYNEFPWRRDKSHLTAWQVGATGYPIVDAGMRQLWATGWMHNRVRMIVASFLVKDLLISWTEGARWFWDTLVDADLAQNTLNWQWAAGCGADAAPYFRVFNPTLQGEKLDREGNYVRLWCPELGKLPDRWIHIPWEAPPEVLARAEVRIGSDYPTPIVDHGVARAEALAAFAQMRRDAKSAGMGISSQT